MTVIIAFATAMAAGWAIDRLAFSGELTGMIRDELAITRLRRKRPPSQ
jgi:hypothetical protein